jgi:hypothetical protein
MLTFLLNFILPPEPFVWINPNPVQIEINQPTEAIVERSECHCVPYARSLGLNLPRGDASELQPNSPPVVGGGVLIGDSHVGVILGVYETGVWIGHGWLTEDNECITKEEFIAFGSDKYRGFVNF